MTSNTPYRLVDSHGHQYPLARQQTKLGRSSDNQIVIQDAQASRHHATIFAQAGQYFIRDEGSKNGTKLNGRGVAGPHLLQIGDRITIGGTEFVVQPSAAVPIEPMGGGYAIPARQSSALLYIMVGGVAAAAIVFLIVAIALSVPRPVSQAQVIPTLVALSTIPIVISSPAPVVTPGPPSTVTPSATAARSDFASKMISAAQGGSVQLPDGTRVDIPPGALTADTLISISVAQAPEDLRDSSLVPSGFPEFGPSGIKFQMPVKVTVPYSMIDMSDAITQDAIVIGRLEGGNWEYVGGTLNRADKTLVADVLTFSQYVPVKMLSSDKWDDILNALADAKFNTNIVDSAYVDIANKIYDVPGGWKVINLPDLYNADSTGGRKIAIDRSYFETEMPAGKLPSSKKNLLAGVILGHEEAHDIHQDQSLWSSHAKGTSLLIRGLLVLQDAYKRGDLQALGAYFQLQFEFNTYKKTGDYAKLVKSAIEILDRYGNAFATNPVCQALRMQETKADTDGVAMATQNAPKWATKQNPDTDADIQSQATLVFINWIESTTGGCSHPPGSERAQSIRMSLKTNDGGLYGMVAGCGTAGVKVTANGKSTFTDDQGRFLLAPIPEGTNSLTLSRDVYQSVNIPLANSVPTKDLAEAKQSGIEGSSLIYACVAQPPPPPSPVPPPVTACVAPPTQFDPPDGRTFYARNTILRWKNYELKSGEYFDVQVWPDGGEPKSLGGSITNKNGEWSLPIDDLYAWSLGKYFWKVRVKASDGSYRSCDGNPFSFTLIEKNAPEPPSQPGSSSSSSGSSSSFCWMVQSIWGYYLQCQ